MKKKKSNLPIIMLIAMVISFIGTFLCAYAFRKTTNILALYMCIIFGTVAIHFLIMHISAPIVFMIFKKKFNYNSFWFTQKKFENNLYRILMVKKWKTKVPTYDADEYSLKIHSIEDVIMNMCHAEVVHEVIFVLSYLPIVCGVVILHWWILILTSFLFSCFHLTFIIIQRYNRPRVIRLYERRKQRQFLINSTDMSQRV